MTASPFGGAPVSATFVEEDDAAALWDDNGTQSRWSLGGNGGTFNSGPASTAFVPDPLGVITSQPVMRQTLSGDGGCRQFRWRDAAGAALPADAWFSSWIYLPNAGPSAPWWNVWQMKTNPNAATGASDPKVVLSGPGSFRFLVCATPPGCSSGPASAPFSIPAGRWVSLEVNVLSRTDSSGRVTCYRDGVQVATVSGQTQYPCSGASCRQWSLDNYSDRATGPIYHALARISATRSPRPLG